MFSLNNKVAVVTGGARGIGQGISKALAKQGAKVAILDIRLEQAQDTAGEITATGGLAKAFKTDVTSLYDVQKKMEQVKTNFGFVEILVNNVGWDKMIPFVKTTPEFWDKIIDINYKGVLNCVYAAIPDMIKKKQGKIINIGSDAGKVGSSGEAVYSGTKGAVIAFSKTMARELARDRINVNVVCPGPTATPLVEEMKADSQFAQKVFSSMDRIIPLGRMGTPADIATAVVFLASEESSFITGQVISVSGGLTM
jgi:2-hydroxycyclohexanecarboxyl-CoA dehydrogenase